MCATCTTFTICTSCKKKKKIQNLIFLGIDAYFLEANTCKPCLIKCATCESSEGNCLSCNTHVTRFTVADLCDCDFGYYDHLN